MTFWRGGYDSEASVLGPVKRVLVCYPYCELVCSIFSNKVIEWLLLMVLAASLRRIGLDVCIQRICG
jgi:hypothetical protein